MLRHFTGASLTSAGRRAGAWVMGLSFLIGVFACATSPLGRKQLMLMPSGQMSQLGAQSFDQMKSEIPVEKDPRINAYVRCVAIPITRQVKGEDVGAKSWEIVVFKDASANAFALPGGKIGVHTGLLPVAKTDAQLAAVIGHEVGHVIAQHGNERVSQNLIVAGGLTAAQILTRNNENQNLILGALGLGSQVGVLLPCARTQESEADVIGLDLMSRAGFDPRQSVDLWKNMMAANGGKTPPEFLSTHPAGETRIRELQANMASAVPKFEKASEHPNCQRP
jgi:predicted Zn-dependent protease